MRLPRLKRHLEKTTLLIQRIVAPNLRYSQSLYEDVLKQYVCHGIHWVDIGCGHQILSPWRFEIEKNLVDISQFVVGIDYDINSLRGHKSIFLKIRGNIAKLPFRNDSFDLVTANMVVEHLDDPETQFKEISRILKHKGIFIFHTPNTLCLEVTLAKLVPNKIKLKLIKFLEGREDSDVFNTFYKANSRSKIVDVASKSGFKILNIKMIVTSPLFVFIPPFAVVELIWIRILMMKLFKNFRPNILAILKKDY